MKSSGDDVRERDAASPVGDPLGVTGPPARPCSDASDDMVEGSPTEGAPTNSFTLLSVAGRAAGGYLILATLAVVAGWGTRLLIERSWLGDAEAEVTAWTVAHRTDALSSVAAAVSNLSDTWTVIGLASGAVIVLLLERRVRLALVFVVGLPLELAVYLSVAYIVDRPRPTVEALASVPSTPSFPSGHVTVAVVLYGGVAMIVRARSRSRGLATFAMSTSAVIVMLVAASRVYEGLHHPTDVVAGAVLGAGCLWFASAASRAVPGSHPDGALTETGRRSS